jgi:glycosyltransferase involved in cell wall biosynthesis
LPRSRVVGVMRDCLFQVHPSRVEAFGMAVLEGMACGKAVLSTRSGGPEDLIQDGVSGVLVQPFSVGALSEGLSALLGDPRRCEQMGARARALVSAYNWEAIGRAYLDLGAREDENYPNGASLDVRGVSLSKAGSLSEICSRSLHE